MESQPRLIDAHVHLWDPGRLDYPWLAGTNLDRLFDIDDLDAAAPSVDGFVFVQADCRADQATDELSWVAERMTVFPALLGMVGFAPIEHGAAAWQWLETLAATPGVVGVRRLLQDEPAGFGLTSDFLSGLAILGELGLPFDACVRETQLLDVVGIAARTPAVTFVLDHLGKPRLGGQSWRNALRQLAQLPNVVCKLSGLTTETSGPEVPKVQIADWLRYALDTFGPERCMFGSDWPVLTQHANHSSWLAIVHEVLAELGGGAEDVLHRTATRVYSLAEPGTREARG